MKALFASIGLAALVLLFAVPASATPGTGVQVETLSKNTVDGMDYVVATITVAPGGGTGWHYHPGEVFGFIREGAMTHYDGACQVDEVYQTGAPVKEGVGPGFVHNGRNQGTTPLVMEIAYINPAGVRCRSRCPSRRTASFPDGPVTASRTRMRATPAAEFNGSRVRNGGRCGG